MSMRRARRGLTFLEVEIALLLLLLGVLAVIQIAPISLEGVRVAEQQGLASQYAQHILESELSRTFDDLKTLTSSSPSSSGSILPTTVTAGASDAQIPGAPLVTTSPVKSLYSYTTSRVLYPSRTDLVAITAEVSWTDPAAKRRNIPHLFRVVGYKRK